MLKEMFNVFMPPLLALLLLAVQLCAARGNTRMLKPALWALGMGAVTASCVLGYVLLDPNFTFFRETSVFVVLVGVPLLGFTIFYLWAEFKKTPSHTLPLSFRVALGTLPVLLLASSPRESLSLFLSVLFFGLYVVCLVSAWTGRIPLLTALWALLLSALNAVVWGLAFRSIVPLMLGFFCAVVYFSVPKEQRRLTGERTIHPDLRWGLLILPGLISPASWIFFGIMGLTCAVFGDTRPFRPGVFAVVTLFLCMGWVGSLGPMDMGAGLFIVSVLVIPPLVVFGLGLTLASFGKGNTLTLPPWGRWVLGVTAAIALVLGAVQTFWA